MPRKIAYTCVDSLRKRIDENPKFFTDRAHYSLMVCTIPVSKKDVADFRAVCPTTLLVGYTDPFYLPFPPYGEWRGSWIPDLPAERWLRDSATGDPVWRFEDRGFYVHTALTARVMAAEHADLINELGMDGMMFDDFDSQLRYRFNVWQGQPRPVRWGKGVQPYSKLVMEYVIASRMVLGAFRAKLPGKTIVVNSGGPWDGEMRMDGRMQESYVDANSFNGEEREHNYAVAYPATWPRLKAMIEAGTLPESIGIIEDRWLNQVIPA